MQISRFPSGGAGDLEQMASHDYPFVNLRPQQFFRLRLLATLFLTPEVGGQGKPITALLGFLGAPKRFLECQGRRSHEISASLGSQDTPTQPYPQADRFGGPLCPAGRGAPGSRGRFLKKITWSSNAL